MLLQTYAKKMGCATRVVAAKYQENLVRRHSAELLGTFQKCCRVEMRQVPRSQKQSNGVRFSVISLKIPRAFRFLARCHETGGIFLHQDETQ